MLVFVHKPFTLFQVIAVDADPRNLAYLRASLDLNNSTNNVRILYNAVRLESNTTGQSTDEILTPSHRNTDSKINHCHSTSNEEATLYPMIPDPSNEGAVHMFTEERLLAENLQVILFIRFNSANNVFRPLSHQLSPSPWQKFWSVNFFIFLDQDFFTL